MKTCEHCKWLDPWGLKHSKPLKRGSCERLARYHDDLDGKDVYAYDDSVPLSVDFGFGCIHFEEKEGDA